MGRSKFLSRWTALAMTALMPCCAPAQQVKIIPEGRAIGLFHWSSSKCNPNFTPDAPARAFRRDDNKIVLLASHYDNWEFVGDDLSSLKPNCASVMPSS